MNSVLVVIVTYNGMKWIDKCINSVCNSSILLDAIVIDNGSTDGTSNYIKNNYKKIIFIQNNENLGFGRANNIGLQYAIDHNYDYVYLLNQDAWLMSDTIELLISIQKQNPEYGILSPFQLQGNMNHLDKNFVSNVCSYSSNPHLFEDAYFRRLKEVYSVPFVMAAHWLISRACLEKVGGFSPTFNHYGEDDNFADRTIYHGFKIGIIPRICAIHDREFRVLSRDKELYMMYVFGIYTLSIITKKQSVLVLRFFLHMLKSLFLYKSIVPLKYFCRVIKEYPFIKKNVEISKACCAFLNKNISSVL